MEILRLDKIMNTYTGNSKKSVLATLNEYLGVAVVILILFNFMYINKMLKQSNLKAKTTKI